MCYSLLLENHSVSKILLDNTVMPMYNVLYVLEPSENRCSEASMQASNPRGKVLAARGSGSEDLRVAIMNQAVSVGATGDEPKAILLESLRI